MTRAFEASRLPVKARIHLIVHQFMRSTSRSSVASVIGIMVSSATELEWAK